MSVNAAETQMLTRFAQETHLLSWIETFMVDQKVRGHAPGTLQFYQRNLKQFADFCETQVISQIDQITPTTIRLYLSMLQEKGHNPGGVNMAYRTVKTFLRWYEAEEEPAGWKNPIRRIKAPKIPQEPIQPVEIDTIKAMIATCDLSTLNGARDRAIMLALLDTGCRANELASMNLEDVNMTTGAILVRQGKGRKPRTVYLGNKARRALRAYLRKRRDKKPALWIMRFDEKMTYDGLRQIIRRRAELIGVQPPGLHDFRRAFALNFLRHNPNEIYSLQHLMGHADLQVLRRYLAQTDQDIEEAHRRGSPVDNNF